MTPQLNTQTSALDFALTVHPVRRDEPADGEEGSNDAALPTSTQQEHVPLYRRAWRKWCAVYATNSFLILVICAILLAFAYPPLGAVYLAPQITATWIAVMFIFSTFVLCLCSIHLLQCQR